MKSPPETLHVAIACGGTGGHLFPGIAVGTELTQRGVDVTLLISPKDVDQQGVAGLRDFTVATLPAVALQGGNLPGFLAATWRSRAAAGRLFATQPPHAVLAFGGFTAAPPVLAGRRLGAITVIHESNLIPGRANRWLAHLVDECFVGFAEAAQRLWHPHVTHTGTPVREQFTVPIDPAGARQLLGLRPDRPTLVVIGGSQGARGLNQLVLASLPALVAAVPALQFVHLSGEPDFAQVRAGYDALRATAPGVSAVVRPFLSEVELALAAATLVVSRAGASSLAEYAAVAVPVVLVPLPTAQDNHQYHNAAALVRTGAARLVEQNRTSPAQFGHRARGSVGAPGARRRAARYHG